jgi:hypothetical protein
MTPEFEDQEEEALGEWVLGYLEEHPHAMETLDGIAEWWIERPRIRVDVKALSHVLELLTERGLLEAIDSCPTRRYRLNTTLSG